MNWKIFAATFGAIFLAELGDKTQLAILGVSAKEKALWSVFLGAMAAFLLATLMAVLFGSILARWIPPRVVEYVAGGLFITIGILMLAGKL